MYIVALDGIAGYDTVFFTTAKGIRAGDLVVQNNIPYIAIGNNIAYSSLYPPKEFQLQDYTILQKSLLTSKTIDIIHWMVHHYFSSYKHVLGLIVPDGIRSKKESKNEALSKDIQQTCIIYPDFWTLMQAHPRGNSDDDTLIIHGSMTKLQKIKAFQAIKYGTVKTVIGTNRALFFDWYNLCNIIVNKPTNRSYSNQSDPRFVIQEVAEKYKEIYNCHLEYRE